MKIKDIKQAVKILDNSKLTATHIQLNIDGSSKLLNLSTQNRPICSDKEHDSAVDLD